MRLVFLNLLRGLNSGVGAKTLSQISAITQNGTSVSTVMASDYIRKDSSLGTRTLRDTLRLRRVVFERCLTEVDEHRADAVYTRYPGSDGLFQRFLKVLRVPIISEHNTLETREYCGTRLLSERLWGRAVMRNIDALVGVTEEICNYELQRSRDYKKPYLVCGNGVDVGSIPIRTTPKFDGVNINLLVVANVEKWHGVDRIIEGLSRYDGERSIKLFVVGSGRAVPQLTRLSKSLGIQNRVLFVGHKDATELRKFYNRCHAAIGNLGLHRIGSSECSPLKHREYTAVGIPFVHAGNDIDFPASFPFRLQISSNETPIDLQSVVDFIDEVYSQHLFEERMREFAEVALDWSVKMARVTSFVEEVVSTTHRP